MTECFEPLYTAAEMRAAEERYPDYPDSIPELMERAGSGGRRRGDARVPGRAPLRLRLRRRLERRRRAGGRSRAPRGRARRGRDRRDLDGYDVIVDALFGTGFHGEPRPEAAELIERMNASPAPVVAVDLPSGVDASTGEVAGAAVDADLTVTFHALKVGLVVAPGRFHAGRVVVADIGLEDVPTEIRRATTALLDVVPRRASRRHEVHGGLGPRRRRSAGHDRRGLPHGDGRAPSRRRLRHARRSRGVAARRGGARARAGEGRLERRRRRRDAGGGGGAGVGALRSGPGSDAREARRALVRALLEAPRPAGGGRCRRRSSGSSPSSAPTPTVLTPHCRRARAPARHATPTGWTRTGSRRPAAAPSASARSCSSRGRTRSSPRPAAASSSATWGRRRSRPPAPATS